jgi:hypothetical protein
MVGALTGFVRFCEGRSDNGVPRPYTVLFFSTSRNLTNWDEDPRVAAAPRRSSASNARPD